MMTEEKHSKKIDLWFIFYDIYKLYSNLIQEDAPDDKGTDNAEGGSLDVKKSLRPTTARRRPPKVQDGSKEVETKGPIISSAKTEGILIDGQNDDVCNIIY